VTLFIGTSSQADPVYFLITKPVREPRYEAKTCLFHSSLVYLSLLPLQQECARFPLATTQTRRGIKTRWLGSRM
jgi:hypothetical protein